MKSIILIPIIAILLFGCKISDTKTFSESVTIENNFRINANISDVLLTLKNSKYQNQYFLYFSDENLLDLKLKDFSYNVKNDTVFVKVESEWLSDIAGDNRNNLVIWNKKDFIYISNKPTKEFLDSNKIKTRILNLKPVFFNLVEQWDTVTLRSKENHLFCSNRFHSNIYRIIFKPQQVKVDMFRFWDLSIPFENENGKLYINTNYNILYDFMDDVN